MSGGLVLPFEELIRECHLLKSYARPFLDKTTVYILDEARGNLESIQKRGPTSKTTKWSIPLERPLRTALSKRESQPDSKSRHDVVGIFSFLWEIRPLDETPWKGRKHLLLEGCASTLIRFVETVNDEEVCLARWTVDVGDHQSPGAHFHYQFNGFDDPPFPKTFDVPRLPAMAMSPFMAMEMAIAELFQDRWKKHALEHTSDASAWRNIQLPRMTRYLQWQIQRLAKTTAGSPWAALKTDRPTRELLIKAP
jgi:hypothetical protein